MTFPIPFAKGTQQEGSLQDEVLISKYRNQIALPLEGFGN